MIAIARLRSFQPAPWRCLSLLVSAPTFVPASTLRIAVLVDGENAESALLQSALEEAGRSGTVTVKRVYGDWMKPEMSGWKSVWNELAVRPMQASAFCTGKSSTDSALIIDAMDLLHSKVVDGICIVSSDSDFTSLALRYREGGLFVMGVGRSTTPTALQRACDRFVYTDNLVRSTFAESPALRAVRAVRTLRSRSPAVKTVVRTANASRAVALLAKTSRSRSPRPIGLRAVTTVKSIEPPLMRLFEQAFQEAYWTPYGVEIGDLKSRLLRLDPTFDHTDYISATRGGLGSRGARSGGFMAFCQKLPQYTTNSVGSAHHVCLRESLTEPTAVGDDGLIEPTIERSIEPPLMRIIDQAFQEACSTPHGVHLGELYKGLRLLDPTFSHKEYGTGGFRVFCLKLTQYTIVFVGSGVPPGYYVSIRESLTEPTGGNNGLITPPTTAARSIDPSLMRLFDQAYDETYSSPYGVELGILKESLLRLYPTFNHSEYVILEPRKEGDLGSRPRGFKAFCEKLYPLYTIEDVYLRRGCLSAEPALKYL
ncbi:NYN domain-containing protein [Ochromonadaceae sp. CCMP2298]|nr:NYN domain-containing protein [Ochromonadaceae sp. CCMP2298]